MGIALLLLSISSKNFAFTILNTDELERALNTKILLHQPLKQKIKVAILDKGFHGYQSEIGKSLPSDTQYFQGPVNPPEDLNLTHGLAMAQILTSIMKEPQLYLYNTYGYSNLKFAIEDLIQKKVDLVLYSEVWEFGNNHDGKGFINSLVDKVLDQGITWVNAAGNFGLTSYTSNIKTLEQDWIQLPDQNQSLKVICQPQAQDTCKLRVVLSWNDFKDDPNVGTTKDLDFALTDDFLNVIQTSGLKQTSDPNEKRPGYTLYPRETIVAELKSGTYYLRVKNRSQNFDLNDELYITIDGNDLFVPSHSPGSTVLNPADNPRVLTVGALDSEKSSFSYQLLKPDLLAMSSIKTEEEGEFRGSSNAAALVAGALGLAKSRMPNRKFASIITESQLPGWDQGLRGLSIYWLGFSSPNGSCFVTSDNTSRLPQQVIDALNLGGLFVQTTAGFRIMTPYDPLLLSNQLYRYQPNDLILTTPEGYRIAPRNSPSLPQGWIEVFQTPQEVGLCQTPMQPLGSVFRLK